MTRWARASANLPVFPWDTLAQAKAKAIAHPDGLADLSVGTPVDPTPQLARRAVEAATRPCSYPLVSIPPMMPCPKSKSQVA